MATRDAARGTIGYNFKRAREAAQLTQSAVAEQLGVTQSAVSEWESGKRVPAGDVVARVAALYRCSTDALLRPRSLSGAR